MADLVFGDFVQVDGLQDQAIFLRHFREDPTDLGFESAPSGRHPNPWPDRPAHSTIIVPRFRAAIGSPKLVGYVFANAADEGPKALRTT